MNDYDKDQSPASAQQTPDCQLVYRATHLCWQGPPPETKFCDCSILQNCKQPNILWSPPHQASLALCRPTRLLQAAWLHGRGCKSTICASSTATQMVTVVGYIETYGQHILLTQRSTPDLPELAYASHALR